MDNSGDHQIVPGISVSSSGQATVDPEWSKISTEHVSPLFFAETRSPQLTGFCDSPLDVGRIPLCWSSDFTTVRVLMEWPLISHDTMFSRHQDEIFPGGHDDALLQRISICRRADTVSAPNLSPAPPDVTTNGNCSKSPRNWPDGVFGRHSGQTRVLLPFSVDDGAAGPFGKKNRG